jgi:3-phosphoshikimate 1-carboxyvinyltransferase
MTTLVVHPADKPLVGSVPVPSDASIAQHALLFGALADGESRLASFSAVDATSTTAACLRALGVGIEWSPREVVISGVGDGGLRAAAHVLDCGAAATTMHLLCGLLAATSFRTTLSSDGIASRTPLTALVIALRQRGAAIEGAVRGAETTSPLTVGPLPGGRRLAGIEYESAVANADLKAGLLISGLWADGVTLFKEPTVSRDHAERMLDALGVPIRTLGTIVHLDPSAWTGRLSSFDATLPGDLSAAAFPLAAAQLVPGSRVTTRGVGVNPTRSGLLEIARDMGAGLTIEPQGERLGEPIATLHAWHHPLQAVTLGGETVSRAADDLTIACALAARASGMSFVTFSDRGAGPESTPRDGTPVVRMLRAFGVACDEREGMVEIEGRDDALRGARIESRGDPAIAMTAAVLALVADGPTRVEGAACVAGRYPKFVATLRALGARIDIEA